MLIPALAVNSVLITVLKIIQRTWYPSQCARCFALRLVGSKTVGWHVSLSGKNNFSCFESDVLVVVKLISIFNDLKPVSSCTYVNDSLLNKRFCGGMCWRVMNDDNEQNADVRFCFVEKMMANEKW